MKADLSRGHRPDRQRGKSYRRVLLQQGRLLLDSDLAALTDGMDAQMRGLSRATAGEAGSPDHAFLATPGMPLALFTSLQSVARGPGSSGLFRHHLDHEARYPDLDPASPQVEDLGLDREYLGRLPALYINGVKGDGSVTVALLHEVKAGETVRVWARVPSDATLEVKFAGQQDKLGKPGGGAERFQPYDFDAPGDSAALELSVISEVDVSKEAWIALIERREPAGATNCFWVRKGWYWLDGLAFELAADGRFPDVSFPEIEGATFGHPSASPSGLFVAYLEGWERLITQIEDPGLLERALGGNTDTCARSRAVGQIKLAALPAGITADRVPAIFRNVRRARGTLTINPSSQVSSDDPCEIPDVQGYLGGENRLYRFEVHVGGGLADCVIKWSRNNGSEVFRAAKVQSAASQLEVPPGADLHDGDLVELLSEKIDLDDDAAGEIAASGFLPPRRAVGQLHFVRELPEAPGRIQLVGSDGAPAELTSVSSQPGLKLRKWHGVLRADELVLDGVSRKHLVDGMEVVIGLIGGNADDTTLFRPGDYWHHEARAVQPNENGAWNPLPHGPERLFAPLALFKRTAANQPLDVLQWYGENLAPLGDLDADHVAYDSDKVGSKSRTVQRALDELFTRQDDADALEWVRITKVMPFNDPAGQLPNDASIEAAVFADGLKLRCNRKVDSATLNQATCYVVLELPYPFTGDERAYWGAPVIGFQPVKIDGAVGTLEPSAGEHQIFWKPASPEVEQFVRTTLFQKMSSDNRGARVLARFTLKGNFIWAHDDPTRNLDGDSFGVQGAGGHTKVALPSGDGRRGGDFEMWFWLVPKSVTLQSLTLQPSQVSGSQSATGTITLSGQAPSGGVVIVLSSDQAAVVLPSQVAIPGGGTTTTFTATSKPVAQSTTVTITAHLTGSTSLTTQLTVVPPKLVQLTLSAGSATSGTKVTGTVSLDFAAPAGGSLVTLQATGDGVNAIPANVLVSAGAAQATFEVDTLWNGGAPASATVSATFAGVTRTATLTVHPTVPVVQALTLNVDQVIGGNSLNGTVTLSKPALNTGMTVALSSNHSKVVFANGQTTQTLSIAPGSATGSFALQAFPVSSDVTVTITADGGISDTVLVKAPVLSTLTLDQSTIGPNASTTGTVGLNGPSADNSVVSLSSSDTTVATVSPSSVTVSANQSAATFTVTGKSFIGGNKSAIITATRGVNQPLTRTITVTPDADAVASALSVSPDDVTGGAGLSGTLTLNKPAFAGGKAVALTSNNAAVRFTSTGTTTLTLTVPAGNSSANFSLSTSPVSSDVTVTISGGSGVTDTVVVRAPVASSVTLAESGIDAGDTTIGTVTLSGNTSGATSVSLSSTNTAAATVPATTTVAAGQNKATFTVTSVQFFNVSRTTNIRATRGTTVQASLTVVGLKGKDDKDDKDDKEFGEKFIPKEIENEFEPIQPFSVPDTGPEEGAVAFIGPDERPAVGSSVMSGATAPEGGGKAPAAEEAEANPGEAEPDKREE